MIILIKGKKVVTKIKCKGRTKHKLRKHFNNKWIEGAGSIRTSNIRDLINTDVRSCYGNRKAEPRAKPYCVYTFNLS